MEKFIEKAQKIIEGIMSVKRKGNIKILCGEGNHRVYNESQMIDAFRYAKNEKEAVIHVIIGPIVSTDDKGENWLLKLEEEKMIDKIYYRPQRGVLFHFGVFEKEGTRKDSYSFLDIELPHRCIASAKERRTPDLNGEEENRFWADKFSVDFDYWVEELSQKPLKEGIPIKLTDKQFKKFLADVEADGKDFDFLEMEELLAYK
ncbi:MAG: hypothetical protein QME42_10455 [bacterium]|nr:hypothetical protein [bacterium]